MKKTSIAVILLLTVIGSTFANVPPKASYENKNDAPGKVVPNFRGSAHFRLHFPGATDINYKVKGQFTEVNFTWNALNLEVFYDTEGELIATCRQIPIGNLPLPLQMSLGKQYEGFVTTGATEFDDANDGLCYYVTVTNDKVTYLLHASVDGSIYVFKKMKN
jgi:hypothetical protein